ncbi:MAG TPA: AsmA family protein [Bryobacteraceae bacterium]|jgi:AsmA protein
MKRIVRWLAIGIGVLLLVVLSAPLWIDANHFRPMLESDLSSALGREVKVGDLKLALLAGSVTTNDLSVADDPIFNRTPFVRAKSLKLAIELWPLITSRRLNVTALTIDQPDITLLQSPEGDWNFSRLGAKPSAKPEPPQPASGKGGIDLSVKLVKITGARFTLGKTAGHAKPLVLEQLNAELRDFSNTSVFPFSLSTKVAGGGSIDLEGKAGPIDHNDVSATPVQASLKIAQLDVAGAGLTEASPGIAGILSFDGTGESQGDTVNATGRVKLERLKLAKTGTPAHNPVELDFAVQHNVRKQSGIVRRGDIHIGKALASLTGTYARQGESMVLKMNLAGPDMPIPELAAMLPAMGVVLPAGSSLQGGTASAKFAMEGPADRLVTSGSLAFNKTRLAGFDLGKKMETVEKLAGIRATPDTEIETLSANLRVAPEGTTADAIKLVVPAVGEMGGSGNVSPTNALAFKMNVAVHGGGILAAVSDKPIPFLVEGTCSEPVFRPDMKAVAQQEIDNYKGQAAKAAGGFLKGLLNGRKK